MGRAQALVLLLLLGTSCAGSGSSRNDGAAGATSSGGANAAHPACADTCAQESAACGGTVAPCVAACEYTYKSVGGTCPQTLDALWACQGAHAAESCDGGSVADVCPEEAAFHTVCLETDGGTSGCGRFPEYDQRCADFDLPGVMFRCSDLAEIPGGCVAPLPGDAPEAGAPPDPNGLTYYCCPL